MEAQMTEEIVKRQDASVAIPSAQNLRMLAQDLLNSGLFPNIKNVAGAITVIEYGKELGIPPVAALQTMSIVNGRLCLEAKAIMAVFQNHGGKIKILERSKTLAKIELSKEGQESYVHEYTMEQAKTEKLAGKDNWLKMPETMLFWRAVATGIRLFDPGAIFGLYSREELNDLSSNRQEPENAGRGVQAPPSSLSGKQENVVSGPENGTSAGDSGFFGEPEPIIDAETVNPGDDVPPTDDGFFADDKGFKPVTVKAPESPEEPPLFSDDALSGIVAAIKEAIRVEGADEKLFKAFLYEYGQRLKPPRKYVGMKFGHPSLSEGTHADLKKLHSEIRGAIRAFLKWEKERAK
jgi:hypothetical protein